VTAKIEGRVASEQRADSIATVNAVRSVGWFFESLSLGSPNRKRYVAARGALSARRAERQSKIFFLFKYKLNMVTGPTFSQNPYSPGHDSYRDGSFVEADLPTHPVLIGYLFWKNGFIRRKRARDEPQHSTQRVELSKNATSKRANEFTRCFPTKHNGVLTQSLRSGKTTSREMTAAASTRNSNRDGSSSRTS